MFHLNFHTKSIILSQQKSGEMEQKTIIFEFSRQKSTLESAPEVQIEIMQTRINTNFGAKIHLFLPRS